MFHIRLFTIYIMFFQVYKPFYIFLRKQSNLNLLRHHSELNHGVSRNILLVISPADYDLKPEALDLTEHLEHIVDLREHEEMVRIVVECVSVVLAYDLLHLIDL